MIHRSSNQTYKLISHSISWSLPLQKYLTQYYRVSEFVKKFKKDNSQIILKKFAFKNSWVETNSSRVSWLYFLAYQAHIALSGSMTSIVKQSSSLGSCPTFPSPNPHFKLTFGFLILCQVLSGGRQRQISTLVVLFNAKFKSCSYTCIKYDFWTNSLLVKIFSMP